VLAQPRAERGLLAAALEAAAGWLVEPAEATELERSARASAPRLEERPVVAVVGLARRCGNTTLARALGAELAARDPAGACAVTSGATAGVPPLGVPAAGRLARTLAPVAGGRARSCGRLCLLHCSDRAALAGATRYLAPLVLDVEDAAEAPAAAALAGSVVICGSPKVEEALAPVVAASLARVGPEPLIVLNRAAVGVEWQVADVALPETRLGAQLALAGRDARGELGRAVASLADLVERVA
jgi:hypothetical protein